MAVFHGKTAKIDGVGLTPIPTTLGWTLTTSADVAESTDMGDTWQLFKVGFDDAVATVEGNARTTVDYTALIGNNSTLKLYIDDTNYLSFTAICTGVTETASKDDIGKVSFSFEMDDALGVVYG